MNVKEISHEELAALVREGHDIVWAITAQNPDAFRSTSHSFEPEANIKRPEEAKNLCGVDIDRAYQLWYSKALAIVHQFCRGELTTSSLFTNFLPKIVQN